MRNIIEKEGLQRFVLFLDNLTSQRAQDFKEAVAALADRAVVWYLLKNATDIIQPVDAGYANPI